MRVASVSGSALTLLMTGTRASRQVSPSNASASCSATPAIIGEWNAPETDSRRTRRAPADRIASSTRSSASWRPETTTWPGALSLATTSSVGRARPSTTAWTASRSSPSTAAMPPSPAPAISSARSATRRSAAGSSRTPAATRAAYSPTEWPATIAGAGSAASAERAEGRDRRREQARLGLARVVEAVGRPVPARVRDRPAERGIGLGEGRGRGRRALGQLAAHPDRLRALRAEEERQRHRAASAVSSSRTTWPYSTASPLSATRWPTVPPRGARTSWRTPSISTCPSSSPLATARPGPRPSA